MNSKFFLLKQYEKEIRTAPKIKISQPRVFSLPKLKTNQILFRQQEVLQILAQRAKVQRVLVDQRLRSLSSQIKLSRQSNSLKQASNLKQQIVRQSAKLTPLKLQPLKQQIKKKKFRLRLYSKFLIFLGRLRTFTKMRKEKLALLRIAFIDGKKMQALSARVISGLKTFKQEMMDFDLITLNLDQSSESILISNKLNRQVYLLKATQSLIEDLRNMLLLFEKSEIATLYFYCFNLMTPVDNYLLEFQLQRIQIVEGRMQLYSRQEIMLLLITVCIKIVIPKYILQPKLLDHPNFKQKQLIIASFLHTLVLEVVASLSLLIYPGFLDYQPASIIENSLLGKVARKEWGLVQGMLPQSYFKLTMSHPEYSRVKGQLLQFGEGLRKRVLQWRINQL